MSVCVAIDDIIVVVRWWLGDVEVGEVLALTVETSVDLAVTDVVADDEVEVSVVRPHFVSAVSVRRNCQTVRRSHRLSTVEFSLNYVCGTDVKFIQLAPLPGRRPVTPRACGARKKAPGRAVYDKFVNV